MTLVMLMTVVLIDDIGDAGGGGFLFTCVRAGATRRAATKIAFILLPTIDA